MAHREIEPCRIAGSRPVRSVRIDPVGIVSLRPPEA